MEPVDQNTPPAEPAPLNAAEESAIIDRVPDPPAMLDKVHPKAGLLIEVQHRFTRGPDMAAPQREASTRLGDRFRELAENIVLQVPMSPEQSEALALLERALSLARTRVDERLIGERICELMQQQELEECRTLAEVQLLGCQHRTTKNHRRAEITVAGEQIVASDCLECGALARVTMPRDWDGTVYVWTAAPRPQRIVI